LSEQAICPREAETSGGVTREVSPMPGKRTLEDRFWAMVDRRAADECWPWLGAKTGRQGYGHFKRDNRVHKAHRIAFELATGIDPGARVVHHHCESKGCVNPAHLSLISREAHTSLHHHGERSSSAKLTYEEVGVIRSSTLSHAELGRILGVNEDTIGLVRAGRTWRHPERTSEGSL
jgi:hypothetical protein